VSDEIGHNVQFVGFFLEKKKKIDEIHKTNQLAGCYLDN